MLLLSLLLFHSYQLWGTRNFDRVFDLKGSLRNRAVGTSSSVQLDEDVMCSDSFPMAFDPPNHNIFKHALSNDAQFLSELKVVDYSLLVGIDDKTNTVVVGIIDYLRRYDTLEKIEQYSKEFIDRWTGAKDASRNLPTIIPPEHYARRFTEAMDTYFVALLPAVGPVSK